MTDPLSVAGTAVGIISLGIQLCQGISEYYTAWKDHNEHVQRTCEAVDTLCQQLKTLDNALQNNVFARDIVINVHTSIVSCEDIMVKLREKLKKIKKLEGSAFRDKVENQVRHYLGPFRESTLAKFREIVHELRGRLQFAMDTLHLEISGEAARKLDDISTQVSSVKLGVAGVENKVDAVQGSLISQQMDEQTMKAMAWLSPLNFWPTHLDNLSRRREGTGLWLFENPTFANWLAAKERILWCPGAPGAGKTILASIVIERLLTEFSKTDIGVAFCYCEYKKQAEQTATALLASLLRQLIERRGHGLPEEVLDVYKTHAANGTRIQIDECSDLLQVDLNRWPEVFMVVDALDEYHKTSEARMELLVEIEKLPPNLHLLCTSRFLADIEGQLGIRYPHVEIRAQDLDIEKYVSSRIEEVARLKRFIQSFPDLKKSIIEAVTSKADGMFLLAQLHLDSLASMPSVKKVRLSLEKLPTGIRSIYDAAFDRICSQNEECVKLALRVLCWLSHATMPLEIRQLQHGLAVMDLDKDESEVEDEALPDVELMLSVCAGLVRVDNESNTTQLVHYTTQEYLDQSDIRNTYFPTGHVDIANACLKYLLLDAFADGPAVSDGDGRDTPMDDRLEQHALLAYAACSWGYHVRECKEKMDQDLLKAFLEDSQRVTAAEQAQTYSTESRSAPEGFSEYCMTRDLTGLHLAARNGFAGVVSRILQEHRMEDITAILDGDERTPLHRAAEQPDPSLIDVLIDAGGRLEARDRWEKTVLHVAIDSGHEGVVQRLLDRGSDIQAANEIGWSPITLAINDGSEACVRVLLDRGCDVNMIGHTDDPYRHRFEDLPLLAACSNSYIMSDDKWDLFVMLLDYGANVNIKLRHGYGVLHHLARRRLPSVVPCMEALLDRGADVDARSDNGETALHQAARYDQEGHITNLLLEKGACIEVHCTRSVTLIQQAATATYDCVNELIYEEGDSSWPKDPREWTYLHQEAIRQAKTVMDLLKARKASILQDPENSTDLCTTRSITYFNILLGLFEDSDCATVKAQVEEALTKLAHVRYNSYAHGIVDRMLHEGGVSIRGGREETLFTLKVLNKEAYASIVDGTISIKLDPDIDPCAEIDEAWTPLHMAVYYGNWKTVMILIEAGANVDAMTQMGRTPLNIAVKEGKEVIAWLLLSKGARFEPKDAVSGIIAKSPNDPGRD